MDRFERLLEGEATEFERSLLDSATDDSPSRRARMRTLAAMGVSAGVAGAAQGAHAATQVAASAAAGASKGAGTASLAMLLKWVGAGALAGSVVAAGVATVTTPGVVFPKHRESNGVAAVAPAPTTKPQQAMPALAVAPPAAVVVAETERRPEPARAAPVPPSRVEKAPAPQPAQTPPAESPAAALVEPHAAPSSAIVAEVDALDRARAALALGDPQAALMLVGRHDAAFPSGVLGPEAVVLRVRALVALGDRAQASAVAARFMAAHPDSAQAARLRAIVSAR